MGKLRQIMGILRQITHYGLVTRLRFEIPIYF